MFRPLTPPGFSSPPSPVEDRCSASNEFSLLTDESEKSEDSSRHHELRTAPIMTRDGYLLANDKDSATQYGVLGEVLSISPGTSGQHTKDPRLYLNTNAPFSAVVCGVQGSGKSHTVACMLENMFVANYSAIGSLEKPLSGLVLHFGEGGAGSRPSEASWVGVPSRKGFTPPKIRVYVSRSSLRTMRAVYSVLGPDVVVEPLLFSEEELDAEAFLTMMSVDSAESAPLYVQIILSILRELGEDYTYAKFTEILDERKRTWNQAQLSGLEQRLSLLNSFIAKKDPRPKTQTAARFAAGQITIIDLSDPFVDAASACGLFEIVTRLFVRADVGTGKVLVVDEAHKYLSANAGSSGLTNALLRLTREQRHLAMRVIISTQEPTVIPPVLLDLCTVAIMHRFSSPSWWKALSAHVSANISAEDAFDKVVRLETGEAIVLAPSGLGTFGSVANIHAPPTLETFGRRYLVMKTRRRVTKDGGASILVV